LGPQEKLGVSEQSQKKRASLHTHQTKFQLPNFFNFKTVISTKMFGLPYFLEIGALNLGKKFSFSIFGQYYFVHEIKFD
jgi:hypothetical protein